MKELLKITGYSKQALFKYRRRLSKVAVDESIAVSKIAELRKRHPRMGCRSMYYTDGPMPIGRDKFEQIGFSYGYKLRRKTNPIKTTWGQRVEVYPNLIEGLVLNGINQVWQSDIFYCHVEGKHCYGFTIMDVYSRRLLALHMCTSLSADNMLVAIRQALKNREGTHMSNCIFHSDRGSQYISDKVKSLLASFRRSMCVMPQENAYVERIQGTIKNDYLNEMTPTLATLNSIARRVMRLYNVEKPHRSLKMKTPKAFEESIDLMHKGQHPQMQIYQGFSK